MSFDVETGHFTLKGRRHLNEDFAAAVRPAPQDEAHGLAAAIADGVSGGGRGLEAAQTSVVSPLQDDFATPDTWETTVALDRVIAARNAWLADPDRRRHLSGSEPRAGPLHAGSPS